ncbi:MAG TPA: hypothetical protein PK640_14420 [Verrucomicrobiota bacterium]|nr:hypothetical protein [Verrucomicrobiota bacterium]
MGRRCQDCQVLATLSLARRKADEALSWVERGIELDQQTPSGTTARLDSLIELLLHTKELPRLVAGHGPSTRPSFLKRAKARWGL